MKKTLILTSTVPGSGGVGDIYIKNIISDLDKSLFVRFSIVKKQSTKFDSIWEGIDSQVIQIDKSHYPIMSTYYLTKFLKSDMQEIASKLILFIQREHIDKIWVTLSSPEIIMLISDIGKKTGVKIYTTIWDVPEYLLQNLHVDPVLSNIIMDKFEVVLNDSYKVSVIEEGMRDYLNEKIRSKSIIVRNGVDYPFIDTVNKRNNSSIRIVFAGSIYAKKEWNSLVESLKKCDFKINGKLVELVCIGKIPRYGIKKDSRIDFKGFMSNEDVLTILSSCDIGYVPYWFSKNKNIVVKTSFPGKIASYVAASLKILFHGPEISSVRHYIDSCQFGICCHTLNSPDMIRAISNLDKLTIKNNAFEQAKIRFSKSTMQASFNDFIE